MSRTSRTGRRWVAAVAAASLVVVGGIALTPSASGAPGLEAKKKPTPRSSYVYGNWSAVGAGFANNQVYTILRDDTGAIFASGTFRNSGDDTVNRVAKLSGTTWGRFGTDDSGVDPTVATTPAGNASPYPPAYPGVYGSAVSPSGHVYVGGQFNKIDDTVMNNVGRWTGSHWQRMGFGLYNQTSNLTTNANQVETLVVAADDSNFSDDTVYALGEFQGICHNEACTSPTTFSPGNLAQWRDDTWLPLSTPLQSVATTTLSKVYAGAYVDDTSATEGDDTLYVGGVFTGPNGINRIAAWSPGAGTWSALGGGLVCSGCSSTGQVAGMAVNPVTKDVFVAGFFNREVGGRTDLVSVAKWDYSDDTWYPVGNFTSAADVATIAISPNGQHLYIGGRFSSATVGGSATTMNRIAVLSGGDLSDAATAVGGQWLWLKSAGIIGVDASVRSILVNNDGSAYVAGDFSPPPGASPRVALFTPGPEPSPYDPVYPAAAPTDVVAVGGWNKVTVDWKAPTYTGSYPITNYLVTASPGNRVCISTLQDAKLTQCTYTSLTPGTRYTFTVQALNGAGWGEESAASNAASPQNLKITSYSRKKLNFFLGGGSEVTAGGIAPGYAVGTRIIPWVQVGSNAWESAPNSSLKVDSSGKFTWKRKFNKKQNSTPMMVRFEIGGNFSNTVKIPGVR